MTRRLAGLAGAMALWFGTAVMAQDCRQALILALDVSGSVDAREWTLQMRGVAAALEDDAVRDALFAMPGAPVALAVFEWAGVGYQRDLLPWTVITDPAALAAVTGTLRAVDRRPHPSGTAMGEALAHAGGLFDTGPACWRRTLDVSADGSSNVGPRPRETRGAPGLAQVTINGLVIGTGHEEAPLDARQRELAGLIAYFRGEVIQGVDAFVESALSYGDYRDAMIRKLLRELQTLTVGTALPDRAVSARAVQ